MGLTQFLENKANMVGNAIYNGIGHYIDSDKNKPWKECEKVPFPLTNKIFDTGVERQQLSAIAEAIKSSSDQKEMWNLKNDLPDLVDVLNKIAVDRDPTLKKEEITLDTKDMLALHNAQQILSETEVVMGDNSRDFIHDLRKRLRGYEYSLDSRTVVEHALVHVNKPNTDKGEKPKYILSDLGAIDRDAQFKPDITHKRSTAKTVVPENN